VQADRIDVAAPFLDKPRVNARPDPLADISALPLWDGTPRFEPLAGGISNISYVATDRRGKYVVRLTRDFPFHNVYRDREIVVARAAHAAGFSPEIVHAAPGVMISRYLDARTLDATGVRADLPRIAELIARFHREMVSHHDYRFDVFEVNRGYFRELDVHWPARIGEWAAINDRLRALVPALPPVFGHHDLLPANLLDDGKRLWLIDFEYAGTGDALFDLGNLSSNAQLSADQSRELLAAYYGRDPDGAIATAHRAMEAASLLREGLWSLVSKLHIHRRDIDYLSYAELNFERMLAVLAAL
jgi:thiamine kinase-like enzyme